MSNFTKKINQLLNETPWYDIKLEIPIDLKFEHVKSKGELLRRLDVVIHELSNRLYIHDNLIDFIKAVMEDQIFIGFMKKYDCRQEVEDLFSKRIEEIDSGSFYKETFY